MLDYGSVVSPFGAMLEMVPNTAAEVAATVRLVERRVGADFQTEALAMLGIDA